MDKREVTLDLGTLYPKQWQFMRSDARYTGYGGARGGGKTHVLIRKAVAGALEHAGLRILILRRTYPELEATLIRPMLTLLHTAAGKQGDPAGREVTGYHATSHLLTFVNGSTVKFGHLQNQQGIHEYQGQEYDWIFLDEATHFTEWEFRAMGACLRGVNAFSKQMFLTCNPGGVGHAWVKRLFVSRSYLPGERGEDYLFIPATVEDNSALLEHSPEYVRMLDALPEDIRAAHRYGDWDALAGQFFAEFRRETHVVAPRKLPGHWPRYRVFDYGLDMFACYWVAVDEGGRGWFYREFCQPGLIVSRAAEKMLELTGPGEQIVATVAPPDLWSTQKDTGRTMAEVFAQCGVPLTRSSNRRVQGWMMVKEALRVEEDGLPGLVIFDSCERLIADLPALQHDEKNPSDCAVYPHEHTHAPDACRYFFAFRALAAPRAERTEEWEEEARYEHSLCGGIPHESYLQF